MAHTLDVNKLPEIFETLKDNSHKLTSWEIDRLEEWSSKYEMDPKAKMFTDPESKVMVIIEQMWVKV